MPARTLFGSSLRWSAAGAGLAAATYAASVGVTWFRYGRPARPDPEERDALLDRFLPSLVGHDGGGAVRSIRGSWHDADAAPAIRHGFGCTRRAIVRARRAL
jgi:hypothetical protein